MDITFLKGVASPLHGEFVAGDQGRGVDEKWARDLIAAGAAEEGATKAQAERAANAAGHLTTATAKTPVERQTRHTYATLETSGASTGDAAVVESSADAAKRADEVQKASQPSDAQKAADAGRKARPGKPPRSTSA